MSKYQSALLIILLSYCAAADDLRVTVSAVPADTAGTVDEAQRKWSSTILFHDTGRVFRPPLADPREGHIRVGFMYDHKHDKFLDMTLGGDIGLLRISYDDEAETSVTVRGLISARFEFFSESFGLLNTDFIGGMAIGHRADPMSYELFIYHMSSHLGDEIIERGERSRIDYSRESIRFLASRDFSDTRVYAGPTFTFRSDPVDLQNTLRLQFGAERQFTLSRMATPP